MNYSDVQYRFPARSVVVDGFRIAYVDVAPEKSDAVILLHDIAGDLDDFADLFEILAMSKRVIALDWLGFGKSDKPPADDQVPFYVELLSGFLETLELECVSIVGHGLGATVAALFAASRPGSVDRLVLSAPFGGVPDENRGKAAGPDFWDYDTITAFDDAGRRHWYEAMVTGWNDRLESYLTQRNMLAQSIYHRPWAHAVADAAKSAVSTVLGERLTAIEAPTLILWGSGDAIVPATDARAMSVAIPRADVSILEPCGHLSMFEQPEEFAREIVAFLTAVADTGSLTSGTHPPGSDESDVYSIEPIPGLSPEIGRLLRVLVDQRHRCEELATGLSVGDVDWRPSPSSPSIGAAILHMGAIAVWYVHEVLRCEPVPLEECTQFQFDPDDLEAPLRAPRKSAARLLADVEWAHNRLAEELTSCRDADLNRSYSHRKGHLSASLRWILWRLIEDAVYHRGQVALIKRQLSDRPSSGA